MLKLTYMLRLVKYVETETCLLKMKLTWIEGDKLRLKNRRLSCCEVWGGWLGLNWKQFFNNSGWKFYSKLNCSELTETNKLITKSLKKIFNSNKSLYCSFNSLLDLFKILILSRSISCLSFICCWKSCELCTFKCSFILIAQIWVDIPM